MGGRVRKITRELMTIDSEMISGGAMWVRVPDATCVDERNVYEREGEGDARTFQCPARYRASRVVDIFFDVWRTSTTPQRSMQAP